MPTWSAEWIHTCVHLFGWCLPRRPRSKLTAVQRQSSTGSPPTRDQAKSVRCCQLILKLRALPSPSAASLAGDLRTDRYSASGHRAGLPSSSTIRSRRACTCCAWTSRPGGSNESAAAAILAQLRSIRTSSMSCPMGGAVYALTPNDPLYAQCCKVQPMRRVRSMPPTPGAPAPGGWSADIDTGCARLIPTSALVCCPGTASSPMLSLPTEATAPEQAQMIQAIGSPAPI